MRNLYVSDLDGTLMQPDARLSEFAVSSINRLVESGTLFTVATARTPATVSSILENVEMRLPAIVMTGAALWTPRENVYSDVKYMEPDTVRRLLDIYSAKDCPSYIYTLVDGMIDIYHVGEMSELAIRFMEERKNSSYKRFHLSEADTRKILDNPENVILLYSMQPTAKTRSVYDLCVGEGVDARMQFYHDIYGEEIGILEAFSPAATKAAAVRNLARSCDAERVIAFGDNINDIPMLKAADIAVAMGNAIPEVREMADVVIGPNTDDSVVKFILDMEGR